MLLLKSMYQNVYLQYFCLRIHPLGVFLLLNSSKAVLTDYTENDPNLQFAINILDTTNNVLNGYVNFKVE